jgi:hypothetical protein
MSVFDDRVANYAVEPAAKAGGAAAAVIMLAAVLHLPRPPGVRVGTVLAGTFFVVFLSYLIWRIVRRARDGSLYRATGALTTLAEDRSDVRRITAVGLVAGALVVTGLWIAAL